MYSTKKRDKTPKSLKLHAINSQISHQRHSEVFKDTRENMLHYHKILNQEKDEDD